jgi:hypothetical protein
MLTQQAPRIRAGGAPRVKVSGCKVTASGESVAPFVTSGQIGRRRSQEEVALHEDHCLGPCDIGIQGLLNCRSMRAGAKMLPLGLR